MERLRSFLKIYSRELVLVGAILVVTFLAFSPCLKAEFVNWDDGSHLYDNISVQTLDEEHVIEIFTTLINKTYIPLTMFSYAIEHHFFGLDPFVYHLNNIILHLLVVIGVYVLSRLLGLSIVAAAVAGAVFALHPTKVESIAWVTERKDVLYAFFYVWALVFYQIYTNQFRSKVRPNVIYNRYFILTVIFGMLSLLAKPMALSLPLILILMDWFTGRKFDRRAIVEKIPVFVITVGIAAVTYLANARVPGESALSGILMWCWTLIFYFRQFLTPIISVPLWNNPEPVSFTNPEYFGSLVLTVLIPFSVWKLRRHRWYAFAMLFFFLSVFFLLRFDAVVDKNVVADRFLYLSSFGFCCLFGLGAEKLWDHFRQSRKTLSGVGIGLIVIVLGIYGARSYQLSQIWQTSKHLWEHQLKYFPDTHIALNNLAIILSEEDEYQEAIERYKKIVKLRAAGENVSFEEKNRPAFDRVKHLVTLYQRAILAKADYVDAIYNLGNLYMEIGDYPQAFFYYSQTIKLDPEYKEAHLNMAVLFDKMGERERAAQILTKFLEMHPKNVEIYEGALSVYNKFLEDEGSVSVYEKARSKVFGEYVKLIGDKRDSARTYFKMGYMYAEMGDLRRAAQSYQQAIKEKPGYVDAIYNLANIYDDLGEADQAKGYYERVIRLDPQHDLAYLNLGVVYTKLGQLRKAREAFERSIKINSESADAYFNLGYVYEQDGENIKASEAYRKAIGIDPHHAEAYFNLGNIYVGLKLLQKAKMAYSQAISNNPSHVDAMVNMSLISYQEKDYQTAIKYLDEARILGYSPPAALLSALESYRNRE